jgi:hypothetical protein
VTKPLAIDLFTGLHGWAEGLIAAGWRVVGFDIVDMSRAIGEPMPEGDFQLVIQNVLTLHGSQFRGADLIVASPPCQFFSYTAMPWTKAKELAERVRADPVKLAERLALFKACFRIQDEASEAAGKRIPLVVENVRGANAWMGRSKYHFGSFHLYGDVPALMPAPVKARKNNGGSWFNIGSPGQTETGCNPVHRPNEHGQDGRKVPGFRFDGSGRSFQSASVLAHEGVKNPGRSLEPGAPRCNDRIANFSADIAEGRKHHGDWLRDPDCPSRQGGQTEPPARVSAEPPAEGRKGAGAGAVWFDQNTSSLPSASPRRKAASAKIAKIPFVLAEWIGRTYFPRPQSDAA